MRTSWSHCSRMIAVSTVRSMGVEGAVGPRTIEAVELHFTSARSANRGIDEMPSR